MYNATKYGNLVAVNPTYSNIRGFKSKDAARAPRRFDSGFHLAERRFGRFAPPIFSRMICELSGWKGV
jgi:hypothetical protein